MRPSLVKRIRLDCPCSNSAAGLSDRPISPSAGLLMDTESVCNEAVRQSAGSLKAIVEQRSDWFRIAPASLHSVGMIARRQVAAAADRTLPLSRASMLHRPGD